MQLQPLSDVSLYRTLVTERKLGKNTVETQQNLREAFLRFDNKKLQNNLVLLIADVDHSLLPWKEGNYKQFLDDEILARNKTALQEFEQRLITVIVTGLGFRAMQNIAHHFDGFPSFDAISFDNGKELYLNDTNKTPKDWIEELEMSDKDENWQNYMKNKVHWDRNIVIETLIEVLSESGFKAVKGKLPEIAYPHYMVLEAELFYQGQSRIPVQIIIDPDESSMYMVKDSGIDSKVYEGIGRNLGEEITQRLDLKNNQARYSLSEHDNYFYFFFSPGHEINVTKASIPDYLLEIFPKDILSNLKAGIGIGDSENDTHLEILELATLGIPFYPIASGTDLLTNQTINNHPRIEIAHIKGDIASAIRKQVVKIDAI